MCVAKTVLSKNNDSPVSFGHRTILGQFTVINFSKMLHIHAPRTHQASMVLFLLPAPTSLAAEASYPRPRQHEYPDSSKPLSGYCPN
jgi:hypothetical protein